MRRLAILTALLAFVAITGMPLQAGLATFVSIDVSLLPNTQDPDGANPYTDDIMLDQLVFSGGTVFDRPADQFRSIQWATVRSGRSVVNAEFGDDDNGDDGNPNPFVSAGLVNEGDPLTGIAESTDPAIQDPAIAAAFAGFSLSQGMDGENNNYSVDLIFDAGITDDNNAGSDTVPEVIFFERGINSDTQIQLIIGGTLENPILSPFAVTVLRGQLAATGVSINTTEIGSAQELGVAGIDLSDFFTDPGGTIVGPVIPGFGARISSVGGGADLYGVFLSAENPGGQFLPVPAGLRAVPEPGTYALVGLGLLAISLARRRRIARGRTSR